MRVPVKPYPIDYYVELLKNGSIWVAYDGCESPTQLCGHAVVLIGMKGDGTAKGTKMIIHDPYDGSEVYPNLGVRDTQLSFQQFEERLSSRALDKPKIDGLNFLAYKPLKK